MTEEDDFREKQYLFYSGILEDNPTRILFLTIITLGLYSIKWIYDINKEFLKYDDETPEPLRGLVIFFVMPFFWTCMHLFFKRFLFPESIIVKWMIIGGWLFIMILSLKFFWDFCKVYGKFTNTKSLLWYLTFYPGYFGVAFGLLEIYNTIHFIIFPIITIAVMQLVLNNSGNKILNKFTRDKFNMKVRNN